jgi:phosphopentomutase
MVNRRQTAKHRRELDAMNTSTEAFRKMIDEKYVRPALMGYSAGKKNKEGVTVNASLNSKSMEKKLDTINKSLKGRNVIVNINQQDSRYTWQ